MLAIVVIFVQELPVGPAVVPPISGSVGAFGGRASCKFNRICASIGMGGPIMRDRFLNSVPAGAITAATVGAVVAVLGIQASAQSPSASLTTLKTPYGERDLQGIWTTEFDT